MKSLSKNKLFKSKTRSCFENSVRRRYIIPNPKFDEVYEIMRKFVNKYNKKYEEYDVQSLLKILTTTNHVRYIRINPKSNLHYNFYIPDKLILSKINQDRYHFSQKSKCELPLLLVLVT